MHLICTRVIEVRPRGLCASSCCCCIHIARPYQVFTIVLQLQPYSCTQRKQADVNDCTRPTAVSPRSNRSGGLITPKCCTACHCVYATTLAAQEPRRQHSAGAGRHEVRNSALLARIISHCYSTAIGPTQICFNKKTLHSHFMQPNLLLCQAIKLNANFIINYINQIDNNIIQRSRYIIIRYSIL